MNNQDDEHRLVMTPAVTFEPIPPPEWPELPPKAATFAELCNAFAIPKEMLHGEETTKTAGD